MTKNAKRIFMLVGGGILALLIVLALFGNTYARYASAGEGDAAMSVALWDVEAVSCKIKDHTSVSPSIGKYGSQERQNQSVWEKAFEVHNESAVSGAIYPDVSDMAFSWRSGFSWGEGFGTGTSADECGKKLMAHFESGKVFEDVVYKYQVLRIRTGLEITEDDVERGENAPFSHPYDNEDVWVSPTDGTGVFSAGYNFVEANGGTLNVYACVLWWSLHESEPVSGYEPSVFGFDTWEEFSDAVDTILCMYADEISFVVNLNTVQASTLPA